MNNEEIEQAKDGLRLQRFWPHVEDIVIDAGNALAAIEELQARYEMMSVLADATASNAADQIELLIDRVNALEVMVDRMTSKDDWEILIDMQRDQLKVRKAFKKVIKQLDDLNRNVA
jgi:Mg2+ and Co2+ transporter CorA